MLPIPPITPYLTVSDAAAAIEFYTRAFGATLEGAAHTMPNTSKIMHARLNISGALIMLADDFSDQRPGGKSMTPEALGGSPIQLAMELPDAQTFWDRAVAGGATVDMPLARQFWGALYGQLTDPFGHRWSLSQTLKQMSDEEMQSAAEETMQEKGTLMGEPDEGAAYSPTTP